MTAFVERVVSFGPHGGLVGILTEPADGARREGSPVFLTWNVGLHHRIGAYRIFVQLARALARQGFSTFRFDLAGLGDSEVSRGKAGSDAERARDDVREAIARMRVQGFDRVVLVGFCSGVHQAHALALSEVGVTGAVFMEGYSYATPGFRLRKPLRYLNPQRWERLLRLQYPQLFGEDASWSENLSEQEEVYRIEMPTGQQFGKDVRTMAERGVNMLFIYVRGDSKYAYTGQLFEHCSREALGSKAEVEFYTDADHTFFIEEHRERVIRRLVAWARDRFG